MSKKKGTSSMEAWSKLDNRLVEMEDLIRRKQGNVQLLEEEYAACPDEHEKKYIATAIKAAKLDLEDEIKFFEGLMADNVATKAAVEAELESAISEEEDDEEKEDDDEEEVPRGPKVKKPGEENLTKRDFEKKLKEEFDKRLKAEVEKKLKEEKTDAAVIAANSKLDRLVTVVTALSEERRPGFGGERERGSSRG